MAVIADRAQRLTDGRPMTVRSADLTDAQFLIDCKREICAEEDTFISLPEEVTTTITEERDSITYFRREPGRLLLVGEYENQSTGWIRFSNGWLQRLVHVGSIELGVAKAFRNQGVGAALLHVVMQWADEHPTIEKITLDVFSNNLAARHLYRKFGFVEEGRCRRAIKLGPGNYIDTIQMARFVGRRL